VKLNGFSNESQHFFLGIASRYAAREVRDISAEALPTLLNDD
jgi:hypothetical protein